jgi:hypothetical protein
MSDNDTPDNGAGPDPIDQAYLRAEAALSDEEARAARRARVLAAVASQPATAPIQVRRSARLLGGWGRGGWLAAAGVVGVSVLVASQIYQPIPRPARTAPIPATPAPSRGAIAASPTPTAAVSPKTPETSSLAAKTLPAVAAPHAAPPARNEPEFRAFPAEPAVAPSPPPPPPVALDEAVGERATQAPKVSDARAFSGGLSAERRDMPPLNVNRLAKPAAAAPLAVQTSGMGASLRAAAANGRTREIEILLDQGAPVDAPDAVGDTALMKSIQADHPAAAALLRRHGASLERANHAGRSARDMAAASGDAALERAIGQEP